MPFVYSLLTNYISAKKFALRSRPSGLSLPMPTAYSQKISPKIVKIWSTNRNKQNYMSIRSTNLCKNTAKYTRIFPEWRVIKFVRCQVVLMSLVPFLFASLYHCMQLCCHSLLAGKNCFACGH